MKVKEVTTYPVSCQLKKPFASATGWRKSRDTVLVEVVTDEGLSGWGEAHGPLKALCRAIEDELAPMVIGADPLDVAVLWDKMQIRRLKGAPPGAVSGIDMALWDLKGRILGAPVYRLIGGRFHRRLQPYATALFYREDHPESVAALEEEARSLLESGFRAIKMKVGFGLERDIRRVSRLREVAGPEFCIMADANESYDFTSALRLGLKLRDLGVQWFEEPLPWVSLPAYKELGERLNMPIAGGEVESALPVFIEALRQRAVQIVQPDPCLAGGITACLHIASWAKAHEVVFCPYTFGSLVGLAAAVHLLAGTSHYPAWTPMERPVLLEWDATENPIRDRVIARGPAIVEGFVDVPEDPGLGIEVDRDAVLAFLVR